MKKIFLVLSVLAMVAFLTGPSYALKGIDDPVPGVNFQVPFIVEMGGSGLDTSIIFNNISTDKGVYGTTSKPTGKFHWIIYTKTSSDVGSHDTTFSAGDVEAFSVRALIANWVNNTTALEFDLDGDGTNDHYVGYIVFRNDTPGGGDLEDTMAYFEYVDLANGQACGTYAAMREYTETNGQNVFDSRQNTYRWGNNPGDTTQSALEVFTADAYATSWMREAGQLGGADATYIQFTPRWYFHNADGETYIIIWKSKNDISSGGSLTSVSSVSINIYNNEEDWGNDTLYLPYELNIIRASDIVPPAFAGSYPAGGWVDITLSDAAGQTAIADWNETEFLLYVWQVADSSTASLNWSALWNDRKVGTN
ncbi:MAG: hypothetical protein K9M96_10540 [Deltaproteobacteria bacterium]|nr:hypothetical protein [Deltaproteobacteria bacterium]